jgi:hypothetical protein
MTINKKPQSIRGIDDELYAKAKAAAEAKGQNIGAWMNEAMAEKLAKETEAKE